MNRILVLIICFQFFSCQEEDPLASIPLSQEQLVEVMTDAYLAEAAMMSYTPDTKDSLSNFFYTQVYEIHGIAEEDFQQSLTIVKKYPELMDSIYSKISARLLELENEKKE